MERRKMERFALEHSGWITTTEKSGKHRKFKVMTQNICAGGAFLLTEQLLRVGTAVKINLILPLHNLQKTEDRDTRINVSGSVVRTESQGIAVCFSKDYQITPIDG